MNYPKRWAWQPNKCPCDQDFIEWMKDKHESTVIFHMGTGLHHKVGLALYRQHDIIGLTYSPAEMETYMELAEQPLIDFGYKVLFGDLHLVNFMLLPQFDIVTLFHLGEYYTPKLATLSPELILFNFTDHLKPEGRILAYKDSAAHIIPLFDDALELVSEYKSLRIYKPK